jgi:hypothetical protein
MKNVFILLLVAAIGGGVYYYFSHKQKTSSLNSKELILGKWKMDSLTIARVNDSSKSRGGILVNVLDTSLSRYEFEFKKDSLVFKILNGKIEDTSYYKFVDNKNILLWDNTNTSKTKWTINKLDTSSLVVQDADSASFFFKKIK